MDENLQRGRRALITSFGGVRYKLKTIDGNFVDTMFIDKRFILIYINEQLQTILILIVHYINSKI